MWNIIVRLASYTRFLKEEKERHYGDLLTYFTTESSPTLLPFPPTSPRFYPSSHLALDPRCLISVLPSFSAGVVARPPRSSSRVIVGRDFCRSVAHVSVFFLFFTSFPFIPIARARARKSERGARVCAARMQFLAIAVDRLTGLAGWLTRRKA